MSKFSCFFLGNLTNKTVTGTAYMWELLIANQVPGPIIMIDQSEILSRSHVQFITLFFGGAQLCWSFYQPHQAARIWSSKTNFLSWKGTFWLFHNKFYYLESHSEYRWSCSKVMTSSMLDVISETWASPNDKGQCELNLDSPTFSSNSWISCHQNSR
jgi:hypothetical protein